MSKTSTTTQDIKLIPVESLSYAPDRRNMGDLKALAASIKKHGLQVPLVVARAAKGTGFAGEPVPPVIPFVVIDGRRRLEAAKLAKLESLPCIVAEDSNPDISLILNTHRLQLSPIELLDSIKDQLVTEPGSGQQNPEAIKALAAKVNLSVDDTLKLLTLNACSEGIKDLVHAKKMPLNVAILTAHLDEKKLEAFIKFYQESRPSYRDAKGWFRQNRAALELREAIFITSGCKGCQFHGDHSPALFDQDELGSKDSFSRDDDRCFNPTCWKEKEAQFRQSMKEKASKQGAPKAGLSARDLYDTGGMVKFAEAARIQPDNCAECKLVKWYKGHATGGKWVLFCPSSCPNIKQPKGAKKSQERSSGQPYVSPAQKLEKGLPLSAAEKNELISEHSAKAARIILADRLFGIKYDGEGFVHNLKVKLKFKQIPDLYRLVKALILTNADFSCSHQIASDHKKDPVGWLHMASAQELAPYLADTLLDEFRSSLNIFDIQACQSLALVLLDEAIKTEDLEALLPENIRALIPPSPADAQKPKKKGKK